MNNYITKKKREKTQIIKIRKENEDITTNFVERIIKTVL